MKVREIMTANPACCTPDTGLQEVARMMEQNDCGCIPVVDSMSSMRPVGTITDRDITIRTVAANHDPLKMKASEIMTTNIATVTPSMTVEDCFDVMEDREIRRVLVVDDEGKCCGIVAQADVVQSNANPVRTNQVIKEISESSPSRNQQAGWGFSGDYGSRSSFGSFMSSGSLFPLLLGVGSGIALSYFMNNRNSRQSHFSPDYSFRHENRMDLTNQEGFTGYVDAEREVEKRQQSLQNRLHNAKTGLETQDNVSFRDENDTKDKSRTAGQGR